MVKKKHAIKNTVLSTPDRAILFLSLTDPCGVHDFTQLKTNFPVGQNWFEKVKMVLDMGYLGFDKKYPDCKKILIPKRRLPRRGKNLHKSEEELFPQVVKDYNTMVSKNRVWVEHAIGGIKRFNCLVHRWRNRLPNFQNQSILIAAGIWNLHLGVHFD